MLIIARKYCLFWLTLISMLLSACSIRAPLSSVAVLNSDSKPNKKEVKDHITDSSEIKELKNELKRLTNAVEAIQFSFKNDGKYKKQLLNYDSKFLDQKNTSDNKSDGGILTHSLDLKKDDQKINKINKQISKSVSGMESKKNIDNSQNKNMYEKDPTTPQDSSLSNEKSVSISSISSKVHLAEQKSYDQAFELLKQSRYNDAIHSFNIFIKKWPKGQLSDDALYWMSEARYVIRKFESALNGFKKVVTYYPDSPRIPEALLKIGYIQYDIGNYSEAANTFRDILIRFSKHPVNVPARTRLRRIEQTIQIKKHESKKNN